MKVRGLGLLKVSISLSISLSIPLASSACVEAGVHDQTVQKLEESRHNLSLREAEVRAYQWQMASLGQQLREAQQRSDARERELLAQIQQLTATGAALTERLKKLEGERAALILASSSEAAAGRDGKAGVRPEELRRMIAAADARNALIVEELTRIERLLGNPAAPPPRPPAEAGAPGRHGPPADVVDPWGFGSRK